MNEADTCRMLVRPKLEAAGWDGSRHFYSEQTSFTDGRIIVPGGKPRRLKKKFSDFLLRYTRDTTLGVVEAKSDKRSAGDGLQQAKEYAEILGLKFAYATNGAGIIEYDFFTTLESEIDRFPSPDELWFRYQQGQGLTTATANAHGTAQFTIPDVFGVPPISQHGNLKEIAAKFGGTDKLVEAIHRLQTLLYAA